MLTLDELKEAMPPALKRDISQAMVDEINNASSDPETARAIRDNAVSFTRVLIEGNIRLKDYVNAIKYVSFKLMDYSNVDAYKYTFPQRYQRLVAQGKNSQEISRYVHNFHKTKIVTQLLEQSMVPTWLLNADVYQEAINTQAFLMKTAKSEMVRTKAAESLLSALKRPEATKVTVDISPAQNNGMQALNDMLLQLASAQQSAVKSGVSTKEIAHQVLVPREEIEDAEVVDEEPDA